MRLKDIGTIVTGNTPSKKNNEYYESNDILFIKPSDIEENYITSLDNSEEYISEKARKTARILPEGAVLVTCIGTIGKVGILKKEASCNQQINAIIPNDKVISKYLAYLIQSKQKILQSKANAPVVPIINKTAFSEIEINICDKDNQEKIVKQLDLLKAIIDKRKEQIEELQNIIKSQFVEMFGDPNIVKSNEKTELKTIMINANNGMARRGNDSDGSIVLRLIELQRNYIDYSNVNKIILKDNEKKKYLLEEGDILFARVNGNPDNVGRCAYYKDIGEEVYHNDHIIRVKFDLHKINPIYLCTLLNDEYGRKEFKNKIKTSAGQYTISQDGIEKVKIPLPQIELQNKFAEFVNEIDKQKFEIENSLKEMQGLYESLMEKYFG